MKVTVLLAIILAGCATRTPTYTLYRSSVTGPMRIHIATFDSNDGIEYNRQPGVKVRYWCEKGRYRA